MDRGSVSGTTDQPVERIDLANHVPFSEPTNRRIARHRANVRSVERNERGTRAPPRRRGCGFGSGMATANHHYIEHVTAVERHDRRVKDVPRGTSLPDAESSEQRVEHLLGRVEPKHASKDCAGLSKVFRDDKRIGALIPKSLDCRSALLTLMLL